MKNYIKINHLNLFSDILNIVGLTQLLKGTFAKIMSLWSSEHLNIGKQIIFCFKIRAHQRKN